ncbi:hypothetical protein ACFY9A_38800 [Streptomyces rubradiris]|uniref:hypothetical protein n=1 Tax=Streptomyces rubradiris TaxID=285531 RepID=UPI0036ED3DD1
MASSRELRIASWNVEHNGRGRSGGEDKRQLAHSIVKAFEPHVYFRQELTRAWDNGKADLYAEGTRLGLMPFMTRPPEGRSRNPVGIMIDPFLFDVVAEYQYDLP